MTSTKNYDMDVPLETTTISVERTSHQNRIKRNQSIPEGILAPIRKKLVIPTERKCSLYNKDGWKCTDCRKKDECCIYKEWICDGENQCNHDDSDEVEGCALLESLLKGS